jgi:hypothetical protein
MTPLLAYAALVVGGSFELSLVLKATLVVTAGLLAARCARRARASTRHLILACTFAALLALPVAILAVPGVALEVPVRGLRVELVPRIEPRRPATADASADLDPRSRGGTERSFPPPWRVVLGTAWAGGAALLFLWLGAAVWRFDRFRRRGVPWLDARARVTPLAAGAGSRRQVDVLLHEDLAAPATCGWWHPVVLLPLDATGWSDGDIRRALVHELEHVRRGDWPVHLAARLAGAAFWFHPLVWIAFRRMCLEAERACDDAVLRDADTTDYAAQLVQLARRLSNGGAQPSLAMASRSDLSSRIAAILDRTQSRGPLAVVPAAFVVIATLSATLAVAPVRAVAVAAGDSAGQNARREPRRLLRALDARLFEAAEEGNVDDISSLTAAGANVDAVIYGDGSPLIAAARNGRVEAVRLLLDRGADPDLPVRGDGSPLIMAAREGHADIVGLLLDRGARIDQAVPDDENALIQASARGHLPVVQLLVARGADVNARIWVAETYGRSGRRPQGEWRTPLGMARSRGRGAVAAFLESAGARE